MLASVSMSFVLFLFLHDFSSSVSEVSKRKFGESLGGKFAAPDPLPLQSTQNKRVAGNLTESLAKDLILEVISKNPDGVRSIEGELSLVTPDEIPLDAFVANNYHLIDWRNFVPKVSDSDIKVTSETSTEAYTAYLNSLYRIIRETPSAKSSAIANKLGEKDYYWAANELVRKYEDTIQAVYALPVPVGLKEFHKKELALLTAQKNVYQKIGTSKYDPLSAIFAMQANEKIDSEFAALKEELKITIQDTL